MTSEIELEGKWVSMHTYVHHCGKDRCYRYPDVEFKIFDRKEDAESYKWDCDSDNDDYMDIHGVQVYQIGFSEEEGEDEENEEDESSLVEEG